MKIFSENEFCFYFLLLYVHNVLLRHQVSSNSIINILTIFACMSKKFPHVLNKNLQLHDVLYFNFRLYQVLNKQNNHDHYNNEDV